MRFILAFLALATPAFAAPLDDAKYLLAQPAVTTALQGISTTRNYVWARDTVLGALGSPVSEPPPAPAPTPTPVPTPAPVPSAGVAISGQTALLNALSGAKGGETFILAPGTYSASITDRRYPSPVTILGQPGVKIPAGGVIKNSANITFRRILFTGKAGMASAQWVVRLENSAGITFAENEFAGVDHTGWAIFARTADNKNIRILGNKFTDLSRGVVFFGGAGIQTEGNSFSGIGDDCIDYSNLRPNGGQRNTISRNTARNSFYNPLSHRDFAQLWANWSLDVIGNDLWFSGMGIADFGTPEPNLDMNVRNNIIRQIDYANALRFDKAGTTGEASENIVTSGTVNGIVVKAIVRIPSTMTKWGNLVDGRAF